MGVHLLTHGRVWVQRSNTARVNSKNNLDYIITARVIILFLPLEIVAQDDVEDGKQIPPVSLPTSAQTFFFFTFQSFISFSFSSASKLPIHDLAAGQSRTAPLDAFAVRNRGKPSRSHF